MMTTMMMNMMMIITMRAICQSSSALGSGASVIQMKHLVLITENTSQHTSRNIFTFTQLLSMIGYVLTVLGNYLALKVVNMSE